MKFLKFQQRAGAVRENRFAGRLLRARELPSHFQLHSKSRQLRKWGSCVRISFSNQKPRMKFTPHVSAAILNGRWSGPHMAAFRYLENRPRFLWERGWHGRGIEPLRGRVAAGLFYSNPSRRDLKIDQFPATPRKSASDFLEARKNTHVRQDTKTPTFASTAFSLIKAH